MSTDGLQSIDSKFAFLFRENISSRFKGYMQVCEKYKTVKYFHFFAIKSDLKPQQKLDYTKITL